MLATILAGNPFQMANAQALRRGGGVLLGAVRNGPGAADLRGSGWSGPSPPLFTYNALFVPTFFMGGLLFQVMSALFRQATELKEDQDLTI